MRALILVVLLLAGLAVPAAPARAQAGPKERRESIPGDPKERRQGVPVDPKERRQGVPVDRAPWLGSWQLIPPPAGRFEAPPYKKVTIRIEPWQDGIAVIYDMVRSRGGISHMEWTGRFDGRDYPVQGVDYVLTNAYRLIDERSYEIIIKRDGRAAATAVAVVSADGKTLTVTTAEQDANGRTVTTAAVYRSVP